MCEKDSGRNNCLLVIPSHLIWAFSGFVYQWKWRFLRGKWNKPRQWKSFVPCWLRSLRVKEKRVNEGKRTPSFLSFFSRWKASACKENYSLGKWGSKLYYKNFISHLRFKSTVIMALVANDIRQNTSGILNKSTKCGQKMSKLPLENTILLCNCNPSWLGAGRGLEVVLLCESLPQASLLLETWSRQPCLVVVFVFLEIKLR